MAFELVTGKAGSAHIDSADVGALLAGLGGSGRYLLATGERLAVSMTDANTVSVGTGDLIMDGRHVRNDAEVTVKVSNGGQGTYRHDLVVLTYSRATDGTGVESVALSVVEGTPAATADAAEDPDYTEGDVLSGSVTASVAIARVTLSGITPTVEPLVKATLLPAYYYDSKPDEADVPSKPSVVYVKGGAEYIVE